MVLNIDAKITTLQFKSERKSTIFFFNCFLSFCFWDRISPCTYPRSALNPSHKVRGNVRVMNCLDDASKGMGIQRKIQTHRIQDQGRSCLVLLLCPGGVVNNRTSLLLLRPPKRARETPLFLLRDHVCTQKPRPKAGTQKTNDGNEFPQYFQVCLFF